MLAKLCVPFFSFVLSPRLPLAAGSLFTLVGGLCELQEGPHPNPIIMCNQYFFGIGLKPERMCIGAGMELESTRNWKKFKLLIKRFKRFHSFKNGVGEVFFKKLTYIYKCILVV